MAAGRAVDISSRLDPDWELRMQVRLYRRRSGTEAKPAVTAIWEAATKS
jgi:hypothetical protein